LTMRTAVVLAILTTACGGGSGPAGPDDVPAAEREAHLQAMKERLDEPSQLVRMTIPEIAALPQFPRAYTRLQLADITALERRGVVVEGFVARLRQMTDGDYHIQLTEAWPGQCLDRDTSEQWRRRACRRNQRPMLSSGPCGRRLIRPGTWQR
jgi:hypothetical protein